MKNTKIILGITAAFTVLGFVISVVQSFTKGIPVDYVMPCCIMTVVSSSYTCIQKKEKKEAAVAR